jgi:1,2-dihydroxy-3-keto-5-methylthiopentene dioxygenase
MAILLIPDQNREERDFQTIKSYLKSRGVWHDRWEAAIEFDSTADQDTILNAYAHVLKPYMASNGYQVADVLNVNANTPNLTALREKFLREHTHTEDEVRFFVDGQGIFWFNPADSGPVFCVVCRAGDLLSVPAGVRHWFDLGPEPFVKVIRIFIDPSGWVPEYTESGIDQNYRLAHVPA